MVANAFHYGNDASMKLRWLLPLLMLAFLGAAKKSPQATVRFHTEANPKDTDSFAMPVMLSNPPRQAFVSKIPNLSERDVVAIYPHPAPDGSMGCAFKFDDHGRIGLDTLSTENKGQSIVVLVNTRQILDMPIDKRITDGIIDVPYGLTQDDILRLLKKFRVMGETKKRKIK
jgi:hypothetical protein